MSWLTESFPLPPEEAEEISLVRYARAYILQLFGGCLFADKSGSHVHLMFLQLLGDFAEAGTYSWGSTSLAWLYRNMCNVAGSEAKEIVGPLILLQIWALDRLPTLARKQIDPYPPTYGPMEGPLGLR